MGEVTQIVEHERPNLTVSQQKRIESLKRKSTGHLNQANITAGGNG
jgi:hypothetical protein